MARKERRSISKPNYPYESILNYLIQIEKEKYKDGKDLTKPMKIPYLPAYSMAIPK